MNVSQRYDYFEEFGAQRRCRCWGLAVGKSELINITYYSS
jgi:hypothetical protein